MNGARGKNLEANLGPTEAPPRRPAPGARRTRTVTGVVLLACIAVGLMSIASGGYRLSLPQLWHTLFGDGDAIGELVVLGLRLPRVLAALGVGAALALAGTIFQGLARNPLASPDIVGFTTGSASGALVVLLLIQRPAIGVSLGALIGGMATVLLVTLIAFTQRIRGQSLVLIGIAVGAMLGAVNDYLLTRAELEQAIMAKTWLFGSLDNVGLKQVGPLAINLAIFGALALLLAPRLRLLEMGDDIATGLGLAVTRSKLMLVAIAIALTAAAIATAGPIGFVALAAPQLARHACRGAGQQMLPAAAMGALLLVLADFIAQRLLAPFQIPVGLVTGALGGAYLAWLLARQWRPSDR